MKYTPRIILETENENRSESNLLSDLLVFIAGMAFIFLILISLVHYSIDIFMPYLPNEVDTYLGTMFYEKFEYEKKFKSDIPGFEYARIFLQKAVDKMAVQNNFKGNFKVFIADISEKNALSLPGGIIVFYRHLIEQADSENELIMIAGHEMGHTRHRDHLRNLGSAVVYLGGSIILFGNNSSVNSLFFKLFTTVNNTFSRDQELRADLFGLEALVKYYGHAGGAISFFEKMKSNESLPFLTGMGTHPSFIKRTEALKEEIRKKGYPVKDVLPIGPLFYSKPNKTKVYNGSRGDSFMNFRGLTTEEKRVIINRGTEAPFSGKLLDNRDKGIYECRQCGSELYESESKFKSGCGWPSFDDEITGAVTRIKDSDGRRTEIICSRCQGHLGHVFLGEKMTDKDTRHCVNSISLDFVPNEISWPDKRAKAYFAGGCFWGVEHLMQQQSGVISVVSGYMGGSVSNPDYRAVCSGTTGHAEVVEVVYDPDKISYESIARLFFEIHDPTQDNRQGPDIGTQYRSEIFYVTISQKRIAEKLIALLMKKGLIVQTGLTHAATFWPAEDYHQDYYEKSKKEPYCHTRTKRFDM